jgi:hypothetical protein
MTDGTVGSDEFVIIFELRQLLNPTGFELPHHGRVSTSERNMIILTRKWAKELDYQLGKELWCFTDNANYACNWPISPVDSIHR